MPQSPPARLTSLASVPIMHDRATWIDADALMAQFGDEAGLEAAERAHSARASGNHIHFCHWRQIERMVVMLSVGRCIGTLH